MMAVAKLEGWALGAAALVLLGAGVYIAKKGVAGAVAGAVGAVGDAAAGAVIGVGQVFGIPATDADKCQAAIASGDRWRQSLDCPAGTFIARAWQDLTTSEGAAGRHAMNPDGAINAPPPAHPEWAMTGATGGSTDFNFPI